MRISHHPYHSFYHRETKAQQRVYIHLVKWTLNSKTEMRHSVLLFVISLFSPFFSLGIFCQFIVLCRLCMLWNWPHVFKQKARKKEHLMTGSIHFFPLTKTFVYSMSHARNCYYNFPFDVNMKHISISIYIIDFVTFLSYVERLFM